MNKELWQVTKETRFHWKEPDGTEKEFAITFYTDGTARVAFEKGFENDEGFVPVVAYLDPVAMALLQEEFKKTMEGTDGEYSQDDKTEDNQGENEGGLPRDSIL